MKNSMGIEKTTFVRDARNARRAAAGAAAFAWPPDAARRLADAFSNDRETGEKGQDGAASKPAQGTRHELLRRGTLGRRIRLRHERPLYKIEIVQQADPRNAAQIMQPAQQKLRHERLRMWGWTARPRSQDMEGTVPRNAGFENQTSQDHSDGTGKRTTHGYARDPTRTSAAAVPFRGPRTVHRRAGDADPPRQASPGLHHQPQQRAEQASRAARQEPRRAAAGH